jgi:SanA protein
MVKKIFNMFIHIALWFLIVAGIGLGFPRMVTELSLRGKLFSVSAVPADRIAIVFGAGLERDGSPSPVLRDRVTTAVQLFQAGKVEKILMSGDNRFVYYNEPASMKEFAISLGVPESVIVLDYAGRRTYDTCFRARNIFGLSQAIVVTQRYHIPRAVFTCQGLGIKVNAVSADLRYYHTNSQRYWKLREIPATMVALWQVWFSKPLPVMGDPEPIFKD